MPGLDDVPMPVLLLVLPVPVLLAGSVLVVPVLVLGDGIVGLVDGIVVLGIGCMVVDGVVDGDGADAAGDVLVCAIAMPPISAAAATMATAP